MSLPMILFVARKDGRVVDGYLDPGIGKITDFSEVLWGHGYLIKVKSSPDKYPAASDPTTQSLDS